LASEWERYLRQQIELGGSEIVLTQAPSVVGASKASHSERSEESGQGTSVGDLQTTSGSSIPRGVYPERSERTRDDAGAEGPPIPKSQPRWKQGCPPIPGPGLAVESPSHVLDDELVALETLEEVAERIRTTHCCALCPHRTNAVPGEGNPQAKLFLVGEGPGATEDAQGRPFVGQAGNLLNGILEAIEVPRDSVYITNIVKCRPPQNRKPLPDEIAACIPYLHRQIEIVQPKVILAMGSTAGEAMLGVRKSLGELRGKVHTYNGIPLVVTYHPAALLRNPNWKKPTWDDVRIARQLLDR
jgi:uracil-DNA glycosylase